MTPERLAEIRERHTHYEIWWGGRPDEAHRQRGELLAEVDRLRAEIRFHRQRVDDADGRQLDAAQHSLKAEAACAAYGIPTEPSGGCGMRNEASVIPAHGVSPEALRALDIAVGLAAGWEVQECGDSWGLVPPPGADLDGDEQGRPFYVAYGSPDSCTNAIARFSTDDAAALSLVRALVPSRFNFELVGDGPFAGNRDWIASFAEFGTVVAWSSRAPTIPLAITLAAAKALGVDVPR